jgi:pimeloyl-ACP methyl ester carboxylesterase
MTGAPAWLDRAQWPWTSRWCDVPDGRLHYVDEGTGDTIVLVHGTPTWGFEWRHVIAALSPRMRVVVPDHLGFGLSDRPAQADYRPEAHAARFAAFMDAVAGPDPVSLVVHDFGGPIALPWTIAHPERVRSLTVVNSWMWSFEDDRLMRRRASMASGRLGRLLYRHANASLRFSSRSHRPCWARVRSTPTCGRSGPAWARCSQTVGPALRARPSRSSGACATVPSVLRFSSGGSRPSPTPP